MIGQSLPFDTATEAEEILITLLRQAPDWRKFHMVGELNATVRLLALAGIRQRHPDASDAEVRRHLAELLLGGELAATVYGDWDEFRPS